MSNRQARIARKAAQRAGTDAYVHLKPTAATPPEDRAVRWANPGTPSVTEVGGHPSRRHQRKLGLIPSGKRQNA